VENCQNEIKKVPTTIKLEQKGSQNEPRDLQKQSMHFPKHPLRNKVGKVSKQGWRVHHLLDPFYSKICENTIGNSFKIQSRKNIQNEATWLLNGTKVNVKTHQKSMPKLVLKDFMEIMKFHVFLEG
jgi:hypothetical protein